MELLTRTAGPVTVIRFEKPTVPAGISARPATDADMPHIKSLISAERHLSRSGIDDSDRFMVAVDGSGALLGATQLKPVGDDGLEIASRIVAPEARGTGVGKLLLWECLRNAAPSGIVDARSGGLYLRTQPKWADAYAPLGFRTLSIADSPDTFTMKATAIAGKLGVPARVLGLPPDVQIDLGLAARPAYATQPAA